MTKVHAPKFCRRGIYITQPLYDAPGTTPGRFSAVLWHKQVVVGKDRLSPHLHPAPPVVPPQVRYHWTRPWHPPQSRTSEGTTGGRTVIQEATSGQTLGPLPMRRALGPPFAHGCLALTPKSRGAIHLIRAEVDHAVVPQVVSESL